MVPLAMAEGTDEREGTGEAPASDKRTRPYEESVAGRSDVDAMGNDKRREVIGGQYGASVRKRLLVYGIAIAVIVGAVILSLTVVSNVDNKEIPLKNTAPWTASGAEIEAPRDVDFNRNGPDDTIPQDEIVNR
jgi:hypothetical protein